MHMDNIQILGFKANIDSVGDTLSQIDAIKEDGEIIQLLNEINSKGTTVIVVTHEHDLVREFGNRVIVIDKGRIVSDTGDNATEIEVEDDMYTEDNDLHLYPENALIKPDDFAD